MPVAPFLALAASLLAAAPPPAPSLSRVFPHPVHSSTLKNGLTLVRVPFHSPGLIAYYSVVRVGSRNETESEHTGFAHFFEHVMFKGTPTWPTGTREALLGKMGFSENAFTSDDVTVYHVSGPSSGLEKLIELEADRFRHLTFTEETFQTEAKAVLGEYHKNAASPELKIAEELGTTAFTRHPYRHTTLGFYEDIKKMPGYYGYAKQFFQRWYTPDNVMLFVVGDFDEAKLQALVEKSYGDWAGKAAQVKIPVEPPQKQARQAHIDWPTPVLPREVHAWRTPAASVRTSEAAVLNVLAAYLAGPTSPLFKDLILDRQLVEEVGADANEHRDPNLFELSAALKDEKNRPAVRAAFEAAVKEISAGKVDPKRIQDIKDNLRYGALMNLETPDQVALPLAYLGGVLGSPQALELIYQQLAKVTPAQVAAAARTYLAPHNRTLLTLTPKLAPAAVK